MSDSLQPTDHAGAVALFRAQVVGTLLNRPLERGELANELDALSKRHFLPPGNQKKRRYGASTLERWYYDYRSGGLDALRPIPRKDRGHARALTEELRKLLLDIRREHPTASAELIMATLVTDGRMAAGSVTASTLRRLFADNGLDRVSARQQAGGRIRRRWQAAYPGQLWHADVCHGPALRINGRAVPLRIHAILDDASRYVVGIQACSTERESEMLELLVKAVRAHGRPGALYLDNGPTYIGVSLDTACARLHIGLTHAQPYDAPARGKMERFWRSLREGLLDHMGTMQTLHDVQVRLLAWLDRTYHVRAHGGLLGGSPAKVWEEGQRCDPVTADELANALTVRGRRRLRKDGTLSVGGLDWETDLGFLAGRLVNIGRSLAEPTLAPWLEHDGGRHPLHLVDPVANASRPRKPFHPKPGLDAVPFDPATVQLDALLGRTPPRAVKPEGGGR